MLVQLAPALLMTGIYIIATKFVWDEPLLILNACLVRNITAYWQVLRTCYSPQFPWSEQKMLSFPGNG